MSVLAAWFGRRGGAVNAVAGAASASIPLDPEAKAVRIVNAGANLVYFRVGFGPATASQGDTPIRAGEDCIFSKGYEDTGSYIAAAGTSAIVIQCGEGMTH